MPQLKKEKTTAYRRNDKWIRGGKVVKSKSDSWRTHVHRRIDVAGRDISVTGRDLQRIKRLGSRDEYRDPVTGVMVKDTIIEKPPRKDRDKLGKSPNYIVAYGDITKKLRTHTSGRINEESLKGHLLTKGYKDPTLILYKLRKRGWIEKSKEGRKSFIHLRTGDVDDVKGRRKKFIEDLGFSDVPALIYHSRRIPNEDIRYFNSRSVKFTTHGKYTIAYIDNTANYWKELLEISQKHDQSVAPDSYSPIAVRASGSLHSPYILFTDVKGNGLLIKKIPTSDVVNEAEIPRIGNYLSIGVPKDARVITDSAELARYPNFNIAKKPILIQRLIPNVKPYKEYSQWGSPDPISAEQKRAIKNYPAEAGRDLIFRKVTTLGDRHNHNIMIQKSTTGNERIKHVDFGIASWTSGDLSSYGMGGGSLGVLEKRVPTTTKGKEKYHRGKSEAINRITILVDEGKHDKKFTDTAKMVEIAEKRKKDRLLAKKMKV